MLSAQYVWAVGEQVTAAKVNLNISDNIAALGAAGNHFYRLAPSAGPGVENLIDGWLLECNGAIVPAASYAALDAAAAAAGWPHRDGTNLTLPNCLDGGSPIHPGGSFSMGQTGGEALHTLTIAEMPTHDHKLRSDAVSDGIPTRQLNLANALRKNGPDPTNNDVADATNDEGGGGPHNNMPPYVVSGIWCVSTGGS